MSLMIELRNIKKVDSIITCEAFFEACKEPVILRYSIERKDFLPFTFPKGYEYCKTHVAFARRYFRDLGDKEPEKQMTFMWY